MTPAANRVHIKHRPDYALIIEYLKNKGLRNGDFTCADVGVHWRVIKSMVNSGALVKVGKNANYNNIYRLTHNIEKEVKP
jgi:hypothetical protein